MANPVKQLQRKSEEYQRLDKADRRRFWSDGILNNALYILMVIFIVYTAIKNKNFLSAGSIANIVSLVAASLPMALGIAGCIVLTGTDLSGGRVVGLTAAVAGALLQDRTISRKLFSNLPAITPGWILLTVLIVVAIGALIGMVNGFFVAKFSLHPFIVTLATQLITYGLILIFFMLNGNNGQPVSGLSQEYKSVVSAPMIQFTTGSGAKISIPWYVLYAVIFVALMWFIWNKTAFGKNMFAVGSNADAAKVSGVNVFATNIMVFALAATAFAAENTTISAPKGSTRTYDVYQIFTGDLHEGVLSNIKWGKNGTGTEETAVDHQIPIVQVRRIVIGIFLMILPSGLIDLHDHFYSHILFHAKLCHTVLDSFFKGGIDINIEKMP